MERKVLLNVPLLKDIPHLSSLGRSIQKGIIVDYARSCFTLSSGQTKAKQCGGRQGGDRLYETIITVVTGLWLCNKGTSLRFAVGSRYIKATCKGGSNQTPYETPR